MKNFKKIREQALRQQVRQTQVFSEGDHIMNSNTGDKGVIKRKVVIMLLLFQSMERCFVHG